MQSITVIITITITIFGWMIVHYLSSIRDRRKEWREFARDTVKLVEKIEQEAILYHTNECRDTDFEYKIKSDIDYLDTRLCLKKISWILSMMLVSFVQQ